GFSLGRPAGAGVGWRNRRIRRFLGGAPRWGGCRLEKPSHPAVSRWGAPLGLVSAGETVASDGFSWGRPAGAGVGWGNRRIRRFLVGAPRWGWCRLGKPSHPTVSRGGAPLGLVSAGETVASGGFSVGRPAWAPACGRIKPRPTVRMW